jgi:hypothetical protein
LAQVDFNFRGTLSSLKQKRGIHEELPMPGSASSPSFTMTIIAMLFGGSVMAVAIDAFSAISIPVPGCKTA